MASLISGYAYDIFISYRQKDNKGDMWVSEFVEALKTELESTFKEEISVYFDINPSDYLLETYDVDESLKDKLKCLVFIPIISRTYCDPKSFAWEHEFKAFVEQASKDQFGLKIKLPNGNVASRVLSIIIYDLDSEDIKLCESVLGGVLRGVEFIYKSAGVNRPLRSNEDHPVDNLSKTYYRDQINKVANTVKEIITALKKQSQHKEIVTTQGFKTQHVTPKNQKIRIISGTLMLLILIILGYFFIPKLFKSSEPVEKTIAVLPFRNLSNDTTQVYFCDGFMEEILNNLQLVKSFTIRSRTSSDQYRNTKKSVITIGKELNVNYLVEGSVAREGDVLKIWIQLIDSKADKHLWSSEYTREMKQIFSLQNEIAEEIVIRLKTVLSPEDIDQIQKSPTKNLEAYDLYLLGMHYYKNYSHDVDFWKAIEYFQRAIEIDSTFALSYAGLADVYYSLINFGLVAPNNAYPKVKEYATKALELNEELENAHCSMGKVKLFFDYDPPGADKEFVRAIEINPNSSIAHITYASFLSLIGKHDEAKSHADYALELDPLSKITKLDRINILYSAGFQNEALQLAESARDSDPNWFNWYWLCACLYFNLGRYNDALSMLQTQISLMGNDNICDEIGFLGLIYGQLGQKDNAHKQLERLENLSQNGFYIPSRAQLYVQIGLGNYDKAIDILEKAYIDHSITIATIKKSLVYNFLFKDPRYNELLKKLGF